MFWVPGAPIYLVLDSYLLTKMGRIGITGGWGGKRVVMNFWHSVMDMECECFCESKAELLECGDSGDWSRI